MSTMPSEREAFGRWFYASKYAQVALPGADDVQRAWDAWQARANLAQPAQAVDVGAIREVINYLQDEGNACIATGDGLDAQWGSRILSMSRKLTRALTGEKAGPVRVTVDPVAMAGCDDACQVWLHSGVQHFQIGPGHETRDEGEWYASQLRIALGLPASPAPDKEG